MKKMLPHLNSHTSRPKGVLSGSQPPYRGIYIEDVHMRKTEIVGRHG